MNEVHVVCAVIVQHHKVLCAQRSEYMSTPLKWEFPGGKVEHNERREEALVRELREELKVEIAAEKFITTSQVHITENKMLFLHAYYCAIVQGLPEATEHAQLRWVPFTELRLLDWAEADIPIVEKILLLKPEA